MIQVFGFLNNEQTSLLQSAMKHPQTHYSAIFDRQALWDPATIDKIIAAFPKNLIDEGELFLILAESIANAVLHGQAEVFGLHARKRGGVVLISFMQEPAMQNRVGAVLALAKQGKIREQAANLPGGLGFPILLKLAHKITISPDYRKMQLWFKARAD